MRRKSKQLFKPIQYNVIDGLEVVKKGPWMRKRTQPDLNCYYNPAFQMAPECNYHVSVWNRKREGDDRVDHHATLDYQGQRIHYGFIRNKESDQQIWVDHVNRDDPKQLKIIELFELFEAEKKDILPNDLVNRLSVPKQ